MKRIKRDVFFIGNKERFMENKERFMEGSKIYGKEREIRKNENEVKQQKNLEKKGGVQKKFFRELPKTKKRNCKGMTHELQKKNKKIYKY